MPLTEQERAEILSRRGGGMGAPSGLPPQVEQIIQSMGQGSPQMTGMSRSGPRMTMPQSQEAVRRDLLGKMAEQKLKAETPVPTESERTTNRVAANAMRNLEELKQLLGAQPGSTKLGTRKPLTVFKQTEMHNTNPWLAPDAKQLRTKFNALVDQLALLRTGKAGEKTQHKRIEAEYNPGEFDQDETIVQRIEDMEKELRGYSSGELKSPMDDTPDDPLGLR